MATILAENRDELGAVLHALEALGTGDNDVRLPEDWATVPV